MLNSSKHNSVQKGFFSQQNEGLRKKIGIFEALNSFQMRSGHAVMVAGKKPV